MRPLTHTYGPEKAQDTLLVIHQREDVPEESHSTSGTYGFSRMDLVWVPLFKSHIDACQEPVADSRYGHLMVLALEPLAPIEGLHVRLVLPGDSGSHP